MARRTRPEVIERYRLVWWNVLLALPFVLHAVGAVRPAWSTESLRQHPGYWWVFGPCVLGVDLLLAVRALRRGVVVAGAGITIRRLLTTQHVGWEDLVGFRVGHSSDRVRVELELGDFSVLCLRVGHAAGRLSFADAVELASGIAAERSLEVGARRPEGPVVVRARRVAAALVVGFVLLLVGLMALGTGLADRAAHRERAARDHWATAEVEDQWFTTEDEVDILHVVVRYTVDRGTHVQELTRRGRMPVGSVVRIVYDPAHPDDADFASRPNRRLDDAQVRDNIATGWWMAALGACLLAALGSWRLLARRRAPVQDALPSLAAGTDRTFRVGTENALRRHSGEQ